MQCNYLTSNAVKDHLVAARMATLLHEAKSDNAVAFREEVLGLLYYARARAAEASGRRYRRPQAKEVRPHRQTLDALLADLLWASGHVEALGYCYRSSNRQSFTDEGGRASSRAYEWQVPALEGLGLIDRWMGFSANEDFDGGQFVAFRRATRMRATPALIAIAQRHGIEAENLSEHYVKLPSKLPDLVVLKSERFSGRQAKPLKCPDTAQAAQLRDEVERINAIYLRHRFEGLSQPQVYRLFNCADAKGFAFNKGGRLYGDFQNISRAQRSEALINGEPVVELDLKASHLTILYGITKTPMRQGDPYHVEDLPRAVVKALVTKMIGLSHTNLVRWSAESKEALLAELRGTQAIDTKVFSKLYPIKATTEKVLKQHPVLHELSPNKLGWADLQFIESEVLISTILRLGEEYDLPALPVHDSIIIPKGAAEIGRTCLAEAFKMITGQSPMIEVK